MRGEARAGDPRCDRPGREALHPPLHGRDGRRSLRARHLASAPAARLGAAASHSHDVLPALVAALKARSARLVRRRNGVTPPPWLEAAADHGAQRRGRARAARDRVPRARTGATSGRHFFNIALGIWLVDERRRCSALQSRALAVERHRCRRGAHRVRGAVAVVAAARGRAGSARRSARGCMSAPLLFWAPTAAGYLNDTLVGMLVIGFAVLVPPEPGVSPLAATTGPDDAARLELQSVDLDTAPADHRARARRAAGLALSRRLPARPRRQRVGAVLRRRTRPEERHRGDHHVERVAGVAGARRRTRRAHLSRWRSSPASSARGGAGARCRGWCCCSGSMIVPLGVVSIFFIIIQPIWIGTWCTLCLIAAAAMLVQIPYSLDELVATRQFLWRRKRAGHSAAARVAVRRHRRGQRRRRIRRVRHARRRRSLRDMWAEASTCRGTWRSRCSLGVWLMFTRLTLEPTGAMANADHLVGALVRDRVGDRVRRSRAQRPLRQRRSSARRCSSRPSLTTRRACRSAASVLCGAALIALACRGARCASATPAGIATSCE